MTDFCVFILTHGRPDNVITHKTLRKQGYTGPIRLIVDNEDKTLDRYYSNFGRDNVIVFDKKTIHVDRADNFNNFKIVLYARNTNFKIAKDLDVQYFIQLDDDYQSFDYKLLIDGVTTTRSVKNLDLLFSNTLDFYKSCDITSLAFAQGGDFIGGIDNGHRIYRFSKRKCMNSFFCSKDRAFEFIGSINEDVNAYTLHGSRGKLFLTIPVISVTQRATQSQQGGLTDIYLERGTYIKSFYTVMMLPSAVWVNMMKTTYSRLHHTIKWDNVAPMIIADKYRRADETHKETDN